MKIDTIIDSKLTVLWAKQMIFYVVVIAKEETPPTVWKYPKLSGVENKGPKKEKTMFTMCTLCKPARTDWLCVMQNRAQEDTAASK